MARITRLNGEVLNLISEENVQEVSEINVSRKQVRLVMVIR